MSGYKTKTDNLRPKNEDPVKIVLKSLNEGSNMILDRSRNEEHRDLQLSTKFDKGLRFVHNPTKSTKRRPRQNRLEIT